MTQQFPEPDHSRLPFLRSQWMATRNDVSLLKARLKKLKSKDVPMTVEAQEEFQAELLNLTDLLERAYEDQETGNRYIVWLALDGRYSLEQVNEWFDRAIEAGGSPVIGDSLITDLCLGNKVPNAPIREALHEREEDEPTTRHRVMHRVADELERMEAETGEDHGSKAFRRDDYRYFERVLGERLQAGRGKLTVRLWVPYEMAVAFCFALELDPVDLGI